MFILLPRKSHGKSSCRHIEQVPNESVHHTGPEISRKVIQVGLAAKSWSDDVIKPLLLPPRAEIHSHLRNPRLVSAIISDRNLLAVFYRNIKSGR